MMSARCLVPLAAVLAWIIYPMAAGATVWTVEFDPNQPEDRIGQVVLQAGDGDTILVGPGTYFEHIPLPPRKLSILSTAGREHTILDGSRTFPDRGGSLFYFIGDGAPDLVLRGFTLRGGTGTRLQYYTFGGGAIAISARIAGTSLHVEECAFVENRLADHGLLHYGGGAILLDNVPAARVVNCSFLSNRAYSEGEQIFVDGGHLEIEGSDFVLGSHTEHEYIAIYQYGGTLTLRSTRVHAVDACSWSIHAILDAFTVDGCTFEDDGEPCVRNISVYTVTDNPIHCRVTESLFAGPPSLSSTYSSIDFSGLGSSSVLLERNSFVDCPIRVDTHTVMMLGNVFYHSNATASGGDCEFRCNVTWPDAIRIRSCRSRLVQIDNLNADPQFCERALADYRIARTSPCSEENSPVGCGRIGLYGVGCEGSATQAATWGKIRFLFR